MFFAPMGGGEGPLINVFRRVYFDGFRQRSPFNFRPSKRVRFYRIPKSIYHVLICAHHKTEFVLFGYRSLNTTLSRYYQFQCFFSREKKNARESHFGPFFQFFHGQKNNFTPTLWPIFQFFHVNFFFLLGHYFSFFFGFFKGRKFIFRAQI